MEKASVAFDLLRLHGGRKFYSRILPWMIRRRYFLYSGTLDAPFQDF